MNLSTGAGRLRIIVIASVPLAVAAFVGLSALDSGPGFPLDDGWIHQTYARNLVLSGRWEFAPGVVSAGSTAPLWTLLLAVGYLFRLPPLLWAFALGAMSLAAAIWMAMRLFRVLWPAYEDQDWIAGGALALSWMLAWSAASGMETLLFIFMALWLLALYCEERRPLPVKAGIIGGLFVLTRPEGVVLLALLSLGLAWQRDYQSLARLWLPAIIPLLPYFAFNLSTSGTLWPNTFYAKQAEYQALLAQPLPTRFVRLLFFSVGGPETGWRGMSAAHLLLAPGLLVALWRGLQSDWSKRRLLISMPALWAGAHVFLYAFRLPVTYQHGRYLWASLPIWILYGVAGSIEITRRARHYGRVGTIGARVATLAFATLLLVFFVLGGDAYRRDVAFVEGEMVATAEWLKGNTPPDALVAAHDIGAIGYFAQRPLLDLAGLVSPEIVPMLGDEEQMDRYVMASEAGYLVTAPGWPYAATTKRPDVSRVYTTNFPWTREQGLNNMSVYRLP